jgi:LacI family transcriptional regulator
MAVAKNNRITIKSIADKLDLSASTISYVLHGRASEKGIPPRTIKKVKNTARQMGYVPNYWAQSLKRQRTKIITSLVGSLGMNWANYLMLGVNKVLRENGYTSFIAVDWSDSEILRQEINSLLERQDEGVICQANRSLMGSDSSLDLYEFLVENGPPVVFVGNVLDEWSDLSNINTVLWNEKPSISKAISHLASTGCKKIAFVGSHHGVTSDNSRYEAYREALIDSGLDFREDRVVWAESHHLDLNSYSKTVYDISKGNSTDFWKYVLSPIFNKTKDRPDAILAINDDIAMRVWEAIDNMGLRVPEDVSIIGIGNLFNYNMYLTSIVEPIPMMGQVAAEVMLDAIKGTNKNAQHKVVEHNELVLRQTTRGN